MVALFSQYKVYLESPQCFGSCSSRKGKLILWIFPQEEGVHPLALQVWDKDTTRRATIMNHTDLDKHLPLSMERELARDLSLTEATIALDHIY